MARTNVGITKLNFGEDSDAPSAVEYAKLTDRLASSSSDIESDLEELIEFLRRVKRSGKEETPLHLQQTSQDWESLVDAFPEMFLKYVRGETLDAGELASVEEWKRVQGKLKRPGLPDIVDHRTDLSDHAICEKIKEIVPILKPYLTGEKEITREVLESDHFNELLIEVNPPHSRYMGWSARIRASKRTCHHTAPPGVEAQKRADP